MTDTVYSIPSNISEWKEFINQRCMTKIGALNNKCINPDWWPLELYTELYNVTSWMPETTELNERIFLLYHNIHKRPLCEYCQINFTKFMQFKSGYRTYCSQSCARKSPTRIARIQETTNTKYGKNREQIVESIKKTNQQKYGVDYTTQSDTMKHKSRQTKHEKYGDEFFNNIKQQQQTNINKYGYAWTSCVPEIKEKMRLTHLENNENKWISQQHLSADVIDALQDIESLYKRNQDGESIQDIANSLGVTYRTIYLKFQQHKIVPIFYAPSKITKPHESLITFVKSLTSIVINDRTQISPKEIDVYCPEKKLGIEMHGVYWHSFTAPETTQEKNKHKQKYIKCADKNIRLLQFWDWEWNNKRPICESIIRRALGKIPMIIGARKTIVDYPSRNDTNEFINTHHLYGEAPYSYSIGLRHEKTKEWLMIMTFSPLKYGNIEGWELVRMVSHSDYMIQGGAKKLWSYVPEYIKNTKVITYSDNRLFLGDSFIQLGFAHHHTTSPSYYYIDKQGNIHNRWKFQKKYLNAKLSNYNNTLTEAENMFANGYRRLWDAGHKCWIL